MSSIPKFKNVGLRPKQSPKEIKEKMRQNYKNKVQDCRSMLMDKLRRSLPKTDLYCTLSDIYKSMFKFTEEDLNDEEFHLMDEFEDELVREELDWWAKEYEKCEMQYVDWSLIENNSDVICPVCQKTNLALNNGNLNCPQCNLVIQTTKSLSEIKENIISSVESHDAVCNSHVEFGIVPEANETHIYLICGNCMEMKLVI